MTSTQCDRNLVIILLEHCRTLLPAPFSFNATSGVKQSPNFVPTFPQHDEPNFNYFRKIDIQKIEYYFSARKRTAGSK